MKALHLFCFLLWLPFMAACNHTPTAPSTLRQAQGTASSGTDPSTSSGTDPSPTPTANSTASATATQAPTRKPTASATATQAPTTTPTANTQPPSQLIYTYQREGGFAGFCDTLTVRPQEAYWKSCQGQSATVPLNPETTQQLQQLLTQYAPYQNSSEDNPGGSDSMTESIQFQGNGNEEMTGEVEKMLRIIASELLGEAYQRQ